MKRAGEQLALALDVPAIELPAIAAPPAPVRQLEAPPEGLEFITDAELKEIFDPARTSREDATADVCKGAKS